MKVTWNDFDAVNYAVDFVGNGLSGSDEHAAKRIEKHLNMLMRLRDKLKTELYKPKRNGRKSI